MNTNIVLHDGLFSMKSIKEIAIQRHNSGDKGCVKNSVL